MTKPLMKKVVLHWLILLYQVMSTGSTILSRVHVKQFSGTSWFSKFSNSFLRVSKSTFIFLIISSFMRDERPLINNIYPRRLF